MEWHLCLKSSPALAYLALFIKILLCISRTLVHYILVPIYWACCIWTCSVVYNLLCYLLLPMYWLYAFISNAYVCLLLELSLGAVLLCWLANEHADFCEPLHLPRLQRRQAFTQVFVLGLSPKTVLLRESFV